MPGRPAAVHRDNNGGADLAAPFRRRCRWTRCPSRCGRWSTAGLAKDPAYRPADAAAFVAALRAAAARRLRAGLGASAAARTWARRRCCWPPCGRPPRRPRSTAPAWSRSTSPGTRRPPGRVPAIRGIPSQSGGTSGTCRTWSICGRPSARTAQTVIIAVARRRSWSGGGASVASRSAGNGGHGHLIAQSGHRRRRRQSAIAGPNLAGLAFCSRRSPAPPRPAGRPAAGPRSRSSEPPGRSANGQLRRASRDDHRGPRHEDHRHQPGRQGHGGHHRDHPGRHLGHRGRVTSRTPTAVAAPAVTGVSPASGLPRAGPGHDHRDQPVRRHQGQLRRHARNGHARLRHADHRQQPARQGHGGHHGHHSGRHLPTAPTSSPTPPLFLRRPAAPAPPMVSGVSPSSGAPGRDLVTITGSGLSGATGVSFGGAPGRSPLTPAGRSPSTARPARARWTSR